MTNKMKRKMAYTALSKKYSKIYFKMATYRLLLQISVPQWMILQTTVLNKSDV